MLKVYSYLEEVMEWRSRQERFSEANMKRFASEIQEILEINDSQEFESALQRTFQTLTSLRIPLEKNFKRVFRSAGEQLVCDWKVSPLAIYLIIINSDPAREMVARAQLYFITNPGK